MMRPISIVIPTLNESNYLPLLLESLARQDFDGEVEVVVVDGHSSDNTLEKAGQFRGKFDSLALYSATADIGMQRNLGAANATHDLLLFLDADVILHRATLRRVVSCAKEREYFVMAVPHRTRTVTPVEVVFGIVVYLLVLIARVIRFPVTNGDFLLTTKRQHERIGGFAEGALLGEDTDYGIRAVRDGAQYLFCWSTTIVASKRRLQHMSLWKVAFVWASAFVHVVRKGPVFDRSKWDYPFGGYSAQEVPSRPRRLELWRRQAWKR